MTTGTTRACPRIFSMGGRWPATTIAARRRRRSISTQTTQAKTSEGQIASISALTLSEDGGGASAGERQDLEPGHELDPEPRRRRTMPGHVAHEALKPVTTV